jgi:hypothetical protein
MANLIGLTGAIGVGKTTVANILKDYGYSEHALADKLKQVLAVIFDLDLAMINSREGKATKVYNDKTVGQLLQMIGQGLREKVDDDIWVNSLFKTYKGDKWVLSDIRYKNEYLALKQAGGILIRIEGNNRVFSDGRSMQHQSEIEMVNIKADYTINNFGTMEDLVRQVISIINK